MNLRATGGSIAFQRPDGDIEPTPKRTVTPAKTSAVVCSLPRASLLRELDAVSCLAG
jgi:hypothetical protein